MAEEQEEKGSEEKAGEAPPVEHTVNFSSFVLSLSTSALMSLGEVENPMTKERERSLPAAKQTIDIIGLLEEKTKGNLDENEGALIKNVLHELRLRYVTAVSSEGEGGTEEGSPEGGSEGGSEEG